jgi:hypothetical protein
MIPSSVVRFREGYRAAEIGPRYTGVGHLLLTSSVSLAAIAFALSRLEGVRAAEWAAVPLSFLIANLGEYLGHRLVMHRPRRGLGIVYQRHTEQHHHFYTHEAMAAESSRDFKMVLFPPVMMVFFFGGLALPIGALLHLVFSRNTALLFAAVAIGYFLAYEWLHLSYHLSDDTWLARLPPMRALRRHHTRHHDLALMGKWNFNITFPIADSLFGTTFRGGERR